MNKHITARPNKPRGLWVRAAKDGTTRFYRVATAYVIWRDMRVTLAIRFVLTDVLNRLKALKYKVQCCLFWLHAPIVSALAI